MSFKNRHTTIGLIILIITLLIIDSFVVIKFFTDDKFEKVTISKASSNNSEKLLSDKVINSDVFDDKDAVKNTNESKKDKILINSKETTHNNNGDLQISSEEDNTEIDIQNNDDNKTSANNNIESSSNVTNKTVTATENKVEQPSNVVEESNIPIQVVNAQASTSTKNEETILPMQIDDEISTDSTAVTVEPVESNTTSSVSSEETPSSRSSTSRTTLESSPSDTTQNSSASSNTTSIGTIEIPKTNVNLPILKKVSVAGMEVATCYLYSTGTINQSGTTIIVGHNYCNGKLFSNNKKLQIGDKVYITANGVTKEYTIYDKFITTDEDISYLDRNTSNEPEIALSTCTDNEQKRLVILAK